MKIKTNMVNLFFLLSFLVIAGCDKIDPGELLRDAKSLEDVRDALGDELYSYDNFPPLFGEKMTTEKEMSNGIKIKVFMSERNTSKLVVCKFGTNGDLLAFETIET